MNTRIRRRRNNLQDQNRVPCTRLIKIGTKKKTAQGVEYPEPLNGFAIYHTLLDQRNNSIIDYEAMAMLGVDKDTVETAIKAGRKGSGLPVKLRFRIQANAIKGNDGWEFPELFQEEYSCYDADGRFCHGDGNRAKQRQSDRSVKDVICNPVGCSEVPSAEYCPYSVNSQEKDKKQKICNYRYRLFLSLFIIDEATGEPAPLNHDRDWGVRFGLGSGSETCGMEISEALEAAANQLDGDIYLITGTLSFGKVGKHYVDPKSHKKATSYVPQVYMVLSPVDIYNRMEKHRGMLLEDRSFQAALPAPAPMVEESEFVDADAVSADGDEAAEEPTEEPPTDEGVSPFDDDPPANGPMRVADASDEDLADALVAFAGDKFSEIATFEFRGKTCGVENVDWFFEGKTPAKREERLKILCEICLRLEATPDTHFAILPCKEASE